MDIDIAHHFGGKAYIKETRIPMGETLGQHMHEFDHLSYLVSGRVRVLVDGQPQTHVGPCCLTIEAGKYHAVQAMTDTVWLCIHGTECTDPEHIDKVLTHRDSTEQGAMAAALELHHG